MAFKNPAQRAAVFENLNKGPSPVKSNTNSAPSITPINTKAQPSFAFNKIKEYMLRKPKAPRYF